jgi:hypothetical protein
VQLTLAMPLLAAPVIPDGEKIVAQLSAATGTRYAVTALEPTPDGVTFTLGQDLVTITDMGAPIPWSDLAGPCTKNWRWPTAEEQCRAAESHHIVTLSTSDPDPIGAKLRLTDVVAADVAASGAIGVYWGDGAVVNSEAVFGEMAQNASREYLPLYLWLSFHVARVADTKWFFATQGMNAPSSASDRKSVV